MPTNAKTMFSVIIDISSFNVIPSDYILNKLFDINDTPALTNNFADLDIF